MRFVTFQDGGTEKIGVRQGDTIIDVSAAACCIRWRHDRRDQRR